MNYAVWHGRYVCNMAMEYRIDRQQYDALRMYDCALCYSQHTHRTHHITQVRSMKSHLIYGNESTNLRPDCYIVCVYMWMCLRVKRTRNTKQSHCARRKLIKRYKPLYRYIRMYAQVFVYTRVCFSYVRYCWSERSSLTALWWNGAIWSWQERQANAIVRKEWKAMRRARVHG